MPLNLYLKWPGLTCPSLAGFTCPLTAYAPELNPDEGIFPPIGMLAIVSAAGAIFLSWKSKSTRNLFIVSFLLIVVFEFLASAFFF
jgi:tryptophan-rich sensory protein